MELLGNAQGKLWCCLDGECRRTNGQSGAGLPATWRITPYPRRRRAIGPWLHLYLIPKPLTRLLAPSLRAFFANSRVN
jgi:hypothetical protein